MIQLQFLLNLVFETTGEGVHIYLKIKYFPKPVTLTYLLGLENAFFFQNQGWGKITLSFKDSYLENDSG